MGSSASTAPNDVLALGIFTGTNLFLCVLAERLRRARWAEAVSVAQEQQLDELSRLNEELSQQSEELSQQSEELAQQNEELQTQSEEIQTLNAELTHREDMLQKLLDAARLASAEQTVMQDICAAAMEMFGPAASAVMVFEQQGEPSCGPRAGGAGAGGGEGRIVARGAFLRGAGHRARTRRPALADASLRPDLSLVHPPGEQPFRAVLAAPMRTRRRALRRRGHLQPPEAGVDGRAVPPGRVAGRPVCPHPGNPAAARGTGMRSAAIVESSDDAILSKDLGGIMQTWNAGAERLFGYRAEEVVGQPITLLLPPERIQEEEQILKRLLSGQHVEHLETVRVAKDGRRIDVSVTVSPVKGQDGQIVGASKIVRDITERKRAAESLAREQANLRAVFDVVNVGMLVIAEDGAVKQVNDTLSRWVKKDVATWEGGNRATS